VAATTTLAPRIEPSHDAAAARGGSFSGLRILAVVAIAGIALVAPLWLLLLSPLLLGVPHVAQDVRLLWLHLPGGLPRRVALLAGGALAVLVLHRAAWLAQLPLPGFVGARFEIGVGLAALFVAALLTPSTTTRRLAVLGVLAALSVAALARPYDAMLALGHLHNVVALGLVVVLSTRFASASRRYGFLAFSLAVAALLACAPALERAKDSTLDRFVPAAFDWSSLERALAPGLAGETATRLVLVFAFLQAMHYAAWLVWLPAAVRPGRSLRGDLGPSLWFVFLAIGAAVIAGACFDPIATRAGYLSLVLFHGWLELVAIVVLVLRRGTDSAASPAR
jgi:hypothetical protein